ncbi:MAG: tetratricopeptide repeat protein [Alcanivorax sp.]|nr:tetratricopeptide repeat protein [Alcanivorax sp.]
MTRLSALPLCALLLAGCASTPSAPPPEAANPDAPPIEYSGETLSNLLVAEVAAQRQALDVTLGYYDQAAHSTHDPKVVSQAAQLAYYMGDYSKTLSLSQEWLTLSPNNQDALQLAILSEVSLQNSDAAAGYLDTLLDHYGEQSLGRLVSQARGLGNDDNLELVKALAQLTDRYPKQAPLWYARALYLDHEGDTEAALAADQKALHLMPKHEDALLLKGQLLFQMGEQKKALRHLKRLVRKYPDARRPRISYIRMLLASGDVKAARAQFREMARRYPDDLDLRFSMALLALEAGDTDIAEQQLRELLKKDYRPDDVRLYLAQAAEQRQDLDSAIGYYLKIQGKQQLRAQVQAARLMYQQGKAAPAHQLLQNLRSQHPELATNLVISEVEMRTSNHDLQGAMTLLNQAVAANPDDTDLRYSRAMTAEKLDDLPLLEKDLRHILKDHPDDASALNALGYTLADRTHRLTEAHGYVSKALALRPDDPAILDSMGWVLYKQGKLKNAREYLRKAYEKFPDPEVAAHYSEVLWKLGAQNQARQVWRDTLDTNPDAPAIVNLMKKLGALL